MSDLDHLVVESSRGQQDLTVTATERNLRVSDLLRRKHLPLNTRCGQRGLCDGCVVELLRGQFVHYTTGHTVTGNNQPQSLRGCEYRLGQGHVALRIPPRSLLAYAPQVVSDFKINIPHAHDPLWQQIEIPVAELHNGQSLEENLCHAVARRSKHRRPVRLATETSVGAPTPSRGDRLGSPESQVGTPAARTVTLEYREDHWLITGVADSPSPGPLGAAIDIGTTTVAILLADLRDGRFVSGAANFNKQMHLGDDVLTRINLCSTDPLQLRHLQELIVKETIAPLLAEALQQAGAAPAQLKCVSVAGNTTMLHLFAGVDPSPMGIAPFTPVFLQHRVLEAATVPFPSATLEPHCSIHLLPSAAAYVGADLTAGALATGLMYDDGPCLLVDVGTNGEIILKQGDHLYGCATAAGPAFEGAGLTNGVRATQGAISHVQLGRDPFSVTTEVIGKHVPIGLCGTAYIDFLAAARRVGLLTRTGRFDRAAVDDRDGRLIAWQETGLALRVAYGQGKTDIVISERDIANLLQAKGAIAAGILTLLERIGVKQGDVKKLYLAGGFGLHLVKENAIGCGLLPGFTPDQIEVVGNTSLAGAYLALLDCGALDEIAKCARQMEVIELNLDPGFEDRYIEQLALP